jgi:hypothetical protein
MIDLRVSTPYGDGKVIGTDDGNLVVRLDEPINGYTDYSFQRTSITVYSIPAVTK